MFLAIFQIFGIIRLLFHLQRIGISILQCITFFIIRITRLSVYIAQVIIQFRVLIKIIYTICADFHPINPRFGNIVELCSNTEPSLTKQHLDRIRNAVYHLVVAIIEQSELEFDHIFILGIKTCHVQHPLKITKLIALLETKFGIETFLRTNIFIRIYTYPTDVLTQIFLYYRRIAIPLSKAGAQKTIIGKLTIQPGTQNRTKRNFCPKNLCFGLPVMIIYTIIFGTHSGRNAQTIPKTLTVLKKTARLSLL